MDQIAALAVQTDPCGKVGAQDATPSTKGESSLRMHHIAAHPATLAHQLGLSRSDVIGAPELLHATNQFGLKAKLIRSYPQRLPLSPLDVLAFVRESDFESILSALRAAEIAVANQVIGFVNALQGAEVKLKTFPYTKYGTEPALVQPTPMRATASPAAWMACWCRTI